jgi:hypothetical protein
LPGFSSWETCRSIERVQFHSQFWKTFCEFCQSTNLRNF